MRRQAGSAILGISNRMEVDDMKLAVIDGQGGRIGAQLVAAIRQAGLPGEVLAIGTNSAATAAMMKAGADAGATGENPVIVACRDADVIIVVKDGKILERGKHAELMRRRGYYHMLYTRQYEKEAATVILEKDRVPASS